MKTTSKRIQKLSQEIKVHGLDKALEVLAEKYTAGEWIAAAEAARGETPAYGLDDETIDYVQEALR